jgi:hypothetical protein
MCILAGPGIVFAHLHKQLESCRAATVLFRNTMRLVMDDAKMFHRADVTLCAYIVGRIMRPATSRVAAAAATPPSIAISTASETIGIRKGPIRTKKLAILQASS